MPAVEPVTNACLPASPKSMASSLSGSGRRSDNGRTLGATREPTMRKTIGLLLAARTGRRDGECADHQARHAEDARLDARAADRVVPRDRDGLPQHDRQARRPGAAPAQGRTIADALTWGHADRSWTVDDYMKAYNVSGVMVVKDGKVMLERYGLGASPRTAGSPSRSPSRSPRPGRRRHQGRQDQVDRHQVTSYIPELKGSAYDGVRSANSSP